MSFFFTSCLSAYITEFTAIGSGLRKTIFKIYSLENKLKHTFQSYLSGLCEHVTRDEYINGVLNLDYNAKWAGDAIVDTAAAPNFYNSITNSYPDINVQTCEYEGNGTSFCEGPTPVYYEIYESDVRNFMAQTPLNCRGLFTIGQGIRMREAISHDSYGQFAEAENILGIESLYEPYKGEYYVDGSNDENNPPLFQPGFSYRFLECNCTCPEPSSYEDISFNYTNNSLLTIGKYESDYSVITHPNHSAIDIDLINEDQSQTVRKCYDNYNKAAIGGSILKFEDGVLNTNVTITLQDSTSINNPTLIQDLQSGLYKIEKEYNDGATQEIIILKEN